MVPGKAATRVNLGWAGGICAVLASDPAAAAPPVALEFEFTGERIAAIGSSAWAAEDLR